ncbi:centromere protein C [Entomortierella parvispora]|uniref:CENP-C homolog n=1 Tax=Entomortierella parvispora TaxID=205924 RepID=A0A9P3LY15_9FUNG|nr:centromere protein C [Entomortierella parvispora]
MERELEKERRDLARRGFVEDKTPKLIEVIDYKTNGITKRVLAAPKSQMDFREVEGGGYQFHRGLEDTDSSMVSGVMKIKGGGEKPTNSTGGTACTMLFYVLKGIVQVTVNERKFVVSTGAQFVVPRGNQYSIANLSRMESHLYFVQAKTSDSEAPVPTASQGRPQSQISSFFH